MSISIGFGLAEFPFADPAGYWRWVDMCEAGGVDSLWQTDRLVSFDPMLECLSSMAALAGRTRRIRFGMNVLSLALRDPVLVARQCATIDFLSEGRLLPAFGIGSPNGPEWSALRLDTRSRGRRTDEALDVISRLWREDRVDYAGEYFTLNGVAVLPRPVQSELPMWIGGSSPAAVRRTARIGSGWLGGAEPPDRVAEVVRAIHAALDDAGRQIEHDHYGIGIPVYFGRADANVLAKPMDAYAKRTGHDPLACFAIGDAERIWARVEDYIAAGVSKFVLRPVGGDSDEVIAQTRRLIEEILPRVPGKP